MGNVRNFYEALAKNEAMKKKAEALNAKHKGKKPGAAEVFAEIAAFAKTEGYNFTVDELKAYFKELPDEALENVAGGRMGGGACSCTLGGFGQSCDCMYMGVGGGDL
jgi:hypothetical protein